MIPVYEPARNKFIKDISLPTIGDAIANSKKRKRTTIPVRQASSSHGLAINKHGKITRVPPQAVLHNYQPLRTKSVKRSNLIPTLPWAPKKYTLTGGLITDWHTRTFRDLKLVSPLLIGFAALMLTISSWQLPEIKSYLNGSTRNVRSVQSTPTQPTASPATKPAGDSSASNSPVVIPSQATSPASVLAPDTAAAPPLDVVIPPVPSDTNPLPPTDVGVEVPPVTIDTGVIQVQMPDISAGL